MLCNPKKFHTIFSVPGCAYPTWYRTRAIFSCSPFCVLTSLLPSASNALQKSLIVTSSFTPATMLSAPASCFLFSTSTANLITSTRTSVAQNGGGITCMGFFHLTPVIQSFQSFIIFSSRPCVLFEENMTYPFLTRHVAFHREWKKNFIGSLHVPGWVKFTNKNHSFVNAYTASFPAGMWAPVHLIQPQPAHPRTLSSNVDAQGSPAFPL
jgi:hypothetical protein